MARVNIPVDTVPLNGGAVILTGVAADAANDHEFINDGKTFLVAENEGVGAISVTVVSVADSFGRLGDTVISVPAAAGGVPGKAIIGPFLPPNWNQAGGTKVFVDVPSDTGLRFYAYKFRD